MKDLNRIITLPRIAILHALLTASLAAPVMLAGEGSGMAFLKLGVSSQGVALGDAMAASAAGAAATYYNPAGLLVTGGPSSAPTFLAMHKEWIQDTRTQFLGTAFSIGEGHALGFSLNTTTVSDIEIRTRPGESQGTFTARDLAVGVSYAHALTEHVRAGISVRYLYEQILVDDAAGFAGDIGVQVDTPIEGLVAGAAIANIGSMNEMRSEAVRLPLLARFGVAYPLEVPSMDARILFVADGLHLFHETRTLAAVGTEFTFASTVAVRAGYQSGSEGRGLSLGGGVRYGILSLDYAYSRLATALGTGHTIALGLAL